MQEGIIIKNISNLYKVEVKDKVYACEARGKFKKDGIIPVVGDRVSITLLNEEKGIVEEILERRNYIKRPKIANITQIIYVLSMNMPKPDLLLLDKQLAFAEFLGINPVICINKIDLEKAEKILEDGTKEEELITDAIDIAASYNHTIILRADGTVWSLSLIHI
mgnify:CR=1 FL=1